MKNVSSKLIGVRGGRNKKGNGAISITPPGTEMEQ